MHKMTIPKQVFKMREFTGTAGNKVAVTGFVFIENDVHYEGEAVGDHKEFLTKLIESGDPLEVPDENMTFNERFGNWKVKFPRSGGGRPPYGGAAGGATGAGGGGAGAKSYGRKYEGEKIAPGRWMEVTEAVYLSCLTMMERHGADPKDAKVIEQARSMTAQFWIEVESNMIDLDKPLPSLVRQAIAREVKDVMGGGEIVDEIIPDAMPGEDTITDMALDYYRERLSKLRTQAEVGQLEGEIRHNGEVRDAEKATLLKECTARKRLLARAT